MDEKAPTVTSGLGDWLAGIGRAGVPLEKPVWAVVLLGLEVGDEIGDGLGVEAELFAAKHEGAI